MTQAQPNAPAPTPKPLNLARMVKVWVLLAVSMTAVSLACWAAMPRERPSAAGMTPDAASPLAALVWPSDLAAPRPWRFIVIHHSATPSGTVQSITQGHLNQGFQDVGYHFIINNGISGGTADGQITPTTRWRDQMPGAHARVANHPEFNGEGIGICLVGDFEKQPPTPAQMAALEMLVLALRDRYRLPLEAILGHGELKNTLCPGRLFPLETFLMDVRLAGLKRQLQARPAAD